MKRDGVRLHSYIVGFLTLFLILSAATAAYYVQTGADKRFCGVTCSQPNGILQLLCNDATLLVAECSNSVLKFHLQKNQRISLNSFSGCWLLKNAQKDDAGLYQLLFYNSSDKFVLQSIKITVLDAVKIQKIIIDRRLQGSDVSLTVLFSGANASVFWELDGGSLPPGYSLKNDNRTLVIENVNEEDEKILSVFVKNPVSEDRHEYCLQNKDERNQYSRNHATIIAISCFVLVVILVILNLRCE